MAKFNDLVKTDPELAAGILQDALVHMVNTYIPKIYVTREELKVLLPIIFSGSAMDPSETNGLPTGGEEEGGPKEGGNPDEPGTDGSGGEETGGTDEDVES